MCRLKHCASGQPGFFRNLRTGAPLDCVLGTVVALAATFSRKLGICVPLAFCLIRLLVPQPRGARVLTDIIPVLMCVGAFIAFIYWLRITGKLPTLYGVQTQMLAHSLTDIRALMQKVTENVFIASAYLGLFLPPMLVLSTQSLPRVHASRGYVGLPAFCGPI